MFLYLFKEERISPRPASDNIGMCDPSLSKEVPEESLPL